MTPEEAIRRPMVTQPPIAGNLDCRARPFHSELCFDIATFRIQPELRESFRLLQRRASSRHYILRKELPPNMFFIDALLRHNIFPLQHWVQRRGVLEGASKEAAPSGCHSTPLPQTIMPDIGAPGIPKESLKMSVNILSRDFHSRQMDQDDDLWRCGLGSTGGPEHPKEATNTTTLNHLPCSDL
ncbi:hypothetical protein AAG906_015310 [Vitis piasezkii]